LTVLLPKGRAESYSVDPQTLATTPAPVDPKLLNETIAYYQTAARAFKRGELRAPPIGSADVAVAPPASRYN
jgi:hypothetical protein